MAFDANVYEFTSEEKMRVGEEATIIIRQHRSIVILLLVFLGEGKMRASIEFFFSVIMLRIYIDSPGAHTHA